MTCYVFGIWWRETTFTCIYEVSSFEICLKNVFFFSFSPSRMCLRTNWLYMFSHRERLCCVLFNVGFLDFYASCSLCSSIIRLSRISNTIEHKHIFRSVLPRTDIFFSVLFWKIKKKIFGEVKKKLSRWLKSSHIRDHRGIERAIAVKATTHISRKSPLIRAEKSCCRENCEYSQKKPKQRAQWIRKIIENKILMI